MRRAAVPLALALVLAGSGCVQEEGPMMEPGQDCLQCHSGGGKAWSFAGTVFADESASVDQGVQGVKVGVEDANGKRVTVTSNDAGNFYSAESLALPFRSAWVERGGIYAEMSESDGPITGRCNSCHVTNQRIVPP